MRVHTVSELEKRLGIWFYATRTAGIGGIIKQKPSDFIVREVTNREEGDTGRFLILELKKDNWDTHSVIRELSRRLGISRKRIGFAGTKDKFAVTTQKISISGIEEDDLAHIRLKDVTLRIIGRSNKPVSLGDLYGNEFEITIRGLKGSEDEILQRINSISAEIDAMGGIPNFFGVQRFGINRPITHIVGERLIRGDVKGAVMTYLAYITPDESESEEVREARQLCQEGNFKECLKRMPLRYERAILNELVKAKKSTEQLSESDYIAAFNALPVNLQKLFIHAYQAYLFNLVLSKRMSLSLSLSLNLNMNRQQPFNAALVGDIVCYRNEHGFADPAKLERVTEEKVDAINRLIKRGRAFVTAPVFGFATELGAGLEGEIEREVLAAEGIELSDFKLNVLPALSSRGTRRPIIVPVKVNCKELSDDEMNPGCKRVKLNFFLPKGSYATVVLREYMKMK